MKAKISIYDSAEGYDLAAAGYDKKEGYLNSFEKGVWSPVLPNLNGQKVLDVGAGTGRLSRILVQGGAEVTAVDVSEKMLLILKKKLPQVEIVVGEAENLPFKDESFDLVTAAFVVVHLKDPEFFFEEAFRVLKPGGKLIVTNINQKEAPLVKTEKGSIKIKSYYHRPEKIIELLEKIGFNIDNIKLITEHNVWINQLVVGQKNIN